MVTGWRKTEDRIDVLLQLTCTLPPPPPPRPASPVFGYRFNISRYLGGLRRNSSGHVTAASAAFFAWAVRRDPEADHVIVSDVGTGEPVRIGGGGDLGREAAALVG